MAPSSIFYWVVDAAADRVPDGGAAAVLREVSEHNLGWLDVDDLPTSARKALLHTLAALPDVARRELPSSPARQHVISRVQELAVLAMSQPT